MFLWYDYIIIILVFCVSILIGVYFGYFSKKLSTPKEYLFGGKQMGVFPIAISAAVGHVSAVTFVGVVADVYKYGAFFWLVCVAVVILTSAAIHIYYPILFELNLTSTYEYLEKRFDNKTRVLGSVFYIAYENLLLPVVVFSPALALSVVTGINVNIISSLICGICVFYTAIGGLRTVIWTDLLQFAVIIVSMAIIITVGTSSVGGVSHVWNTAVKGGRLDIFDFDPNPTKKDSFWICVIGLTARFLYYYCLSQAGVQKYLSLPTFRDCVRALMCSAVCICVMFTTSIFLGLLIYTTYVDCDPLMDKKISKIDHVVPYYISQMAERIPGISGLFMATLLSASVSTLSSSLNSLSGVIYKDLVSKFLNPKTFEDKAVSILKLIVVMEGILCACLIVLFQNLGDILPLAVGMTGLLDGPSVGLFTLGILFPSVNSNGAFFGALGGLITIGCIYFPAMYYNFHRAIVYPGKHFSIEGCADIGNISSGNPTVLSNNSTNSRPFALFRISYNYYCFIGAVATIILGLIISFLTTKKNSSVVEKKVSSPLLPQSELHIFNNRVIE